MFDVTPPLCAIQVGRLRADDGVCGRSAVAAAAAAECATKNKIAEKEALINLCIQTSKQISVFSFN